VDGELGAEPEVHGYIIQVVLMIAPLRA